MDWLGSSSAGVQIVHILSISCLVVVCFAVLVGHMKAVDVGIAFVEVLFSIIIFVVVLHFDVLFLYPSQCFLLDQNAQVLEELVALLMGLLHSLVAGQPKAVAEFVVVSLLLQTLMPE